eukprot:m.58945 g.58945  ORF g.58945 m.58945 type:complete len:130 (+) comp15662_c0_seq2:142-531(+)
MSSPSTEELEALGILDDDHVFSTGNNNSTVFIDTQPDLVARIEELKQQLREKRASSHECKSRTAEAVARAKVLLKERDAIRVERVAAEKEKRESEPNVYHSSWYDKHSKSHADTQNNHMEARLPRSPWK